MVEMDVVGVLSEKGGVGKTTTTVGLAAELASRGVKVGVVDFDPRATATTWLGVQGPPGEHVGAILALDDVEGAAADLAIRSPWDAGISVVPGSREVAALEASPQEYGDLRFRRALAGWDRDVVLCDCPNRQGGFLIRNVLVAATRVLYAAVPDEDGRSGVEWARWNVARFRQLSPLNPDIDEAGVVVTGWSDNVTPRVQKDALAALDEEHPGLVLRPLVPERTAVPASRAAEVWWGSFARGERVAYAFARLVDQLWPDTRGDNR